LAAAEFIPALLAPDHSQSDVSAPNSACDKLYSLLGTSLGNFYLAETAQSAYAFE
jgi:hypothetical protein